MATPIACSMNRRVSACSLACRLLRDPGAIFLPAHPEPSFVDRRTHADFRRASLLETVSLSTQMSSRTALISSSSCCWAISETSACRMWVISRLPAVCPGSPGRHLDRQLRLAV
jgi:hypothetical protein